MEDAMTLEQACAEASRLLGRRVAPVRNPYVLTNPPQRFLRDVHERGAASFYEVGDVFVHVPNPEQRLNKVLCQSLYQISANEGPLGILRDDRQWQRLADSSFIAGDPKLAVGSCTGYSPASLSLVGRVLEAAGVVPDDSLCRSVCNGLAVYDKSILSKAISSGDSDALSRAMLSSMDGYDGKTYLHFGVAAGPWLDMKYPVKDITASANLLRKLSERSGMSVRDLASEGLVAKLRAPLAVLKSRHDENQVMMVLDMHDAAGDYITVFAPSAKTASESEDTSIRVTGFGSISETSLLKTLAWKHPEGDKTNIIYLKKKEGSAVAYEIGDFIRRALRGDIKKSRAGAHRVVAQDDITSSLSCTAKVQSFSEKTKKDEDIFEGDKKSRAGAHRVVAQDGIAGSLKRDAKVDTFSEISKPDDRFLVESSQRKPRPRINRSPVPQPEPAPALTPAEKEDLAAFAARAKNNIEVHRNPKNFAAMDAGLFSGPGQPAEKPAQTPIPDAGVRRDEPVVRAHRRSVAERLAMPLPEKDFTAATLKKLLPAAPTVGALAGLLRDVGDDGFRARYGPKALAAATRLLEAQGLRSVTLFQRRRVANAEARPYEDVNAEDVFYRLREMPRGVAPGTLALPRRADGTPFVGSDAYHLVAAMANNPRWRGCNCFVTKDDLQALHLPLPPSAEPLYLKGGAVYCLADVLPLRRTRDVAVALMAADAPPVPQPMLTQMDSYREPRDREQAAAFARRFEASFDRMTEGALAAFPGRTLQQVLDIAVATAAREMEGMETLRSCTFPQDQASQLLLTGEVTYEGPLRMPDGGRQNVLLRLRVTPDATIEALTPKGRALGPVKDILAKKHNLSPERIRALDGEGGTPPPGTTLRRR